MAVVDCPSTKDSIFTSPPALMTQSPLALVGTLSLVDFYFGSQVDVALSLGLFAITVNQLRKVSTNSVEECAV
jgi:hypothetical protein